MPRTETTELEDNLKCHYYSINQFKIADLLCKSLIDGYINIGEFTCASAYRDENCQIFVSNRKIIIKMDKDVFQSIGAVYLSKCQSKKEDKLIYFQVDFATNELEKIRKELQNEMIDKLDMCFQWKPESTDICESSIAKFFTNMNYDVKALTNLNTQNNLYNLSLPEIPLDNDDDDDNDYELTELMDFVALTMLDCDLSENSFSSYRAPVKMVEINKGQCLHFKGFISKRALECLFEHVQKFLKDPSFPYIAISLIPYSKLQSNTYSKLFIVTSESIIVAE